MNEFWHSSRTIAPDAVDWAAQMGRVWNECIRDFVHPDYIIVHSSVWQWWRAKFLRSMQKPSGGRKAKRYNRQRLAYLARRA